MQFTTLIALLFIGASTSGSAAPVSVLEGAGNVLWSAGKAQEQMESLGFGSSN
ncbi:hypothetical protein ABW20_dc0109115 [Dactylellina cionopaga]|nr:hypothetical protein ABW20_dc0109115 [Dactylellina cionopaga]